VYFGSEVKFIRALLGRVLAINFDHLQRVVTRVDAGLDQGVGRLRHDRLEHVGSRAASVGALDKCHKGH
jgi:hypothetical protein